MVEASGSTSGHGGNTSGSHGGSAGGSHGGGGHGNPAMAAIFAQRQLVTDRQMKLYAASLCGLIAIFVLFHWARWLCTRAERSLNSGKTPVLGRPFVMGSRSILLFPYPLKLSRVLSVGWLMLNRRAGLCEMSLCGEFQDSNLPGMLCL